MAEEKKDKRQKEPKEPFVEPIICRYDPKKNPAIIEIYVAGKPQSIGVLKKTASIEDSFDWHEIRKPINRMLDFAGDSACLTVLLSPKGSLPCEHTITSNYVTGKIHTAQSGEPLQNPLPEILLRWAPEGIRDFLCEKPSVDPVGLFRDILSTLKNFIYFDKEEYYLLLTLWIMGTYLFPLFPAYPFFLLNGPYGSGKTRTTKIASYLCFNSSLLASPNEAIIYRLVDTYRSSLFIDNIESLSKPNYTRLTDTLNSSYKKGAKVARQAGRKTGPPKEYEIYSPKMFNNTTGAETIIGSRCIIVNQMRAPKTVSLIKNDPTGDEPVWGELRNRLYLFMFRYWKQIENLIPEQNTSKIAGRDHELFVGILSIAQLLDKLHGNDNLHKTIMDSAVRLAEEKNNEYLANHPEALVMQALLSIVKKDGWYSVYKIAQELQKYSLEDKKMTDAWVGRILNGMGIGKTRSTWRRADEVVMGKTKKLKQYSITRQQVEDLARKYGIPKDL